MASWGDINSILNRLVREGEIGSFWTNLGDPKTALGLHVIVTPPRVVGDEEAAALRGRVEFALGRLNAGATVTVDRSGGTVSFPEGRGAKPSG
jgi:hypothetical protein